MNSRTRHLFVFRFQAMGGGNEIQILSASEQGAEEIVAPVINEIKAFEAKYSRYREDSIVSQINRNAGIRAVEVDEETARLIDYAATCYNESGELFDITSGILRRAWDFKSGRIPSREEIAELLPLIGWDKVRWENGEILLTRSGMEIDLGGFGKEYAVDKAAGMLHASGVESALINFGGDVRVIGPRPGRKPWNVGIKHPRIEGKTISAVAITKGALATSGDYERFMIADGRRYCHILNPKTGMPVEGFQSVTVTAESCLVAGSIATFAMLKGESEGLQFLKECGKEFICIDRNGSVAPPRKS